MRLTTADFETSSTCGEDTLMCDEIMGLEYVGTGICRWKSKRSDRPSARKNTLQWQSSTHV